MKARSSRSIADDKTKGQLYWEKQALDDEGTVQLRQDCKQCHWEFVREGVSPARTHTRKGLCRMKEAPPRRKKGGVAAKPVRKAAPRSGTLIKHSPNGTPQPVGDSPRVAALKSVLADAQLSEDHKLVKELKKKIEKTRRKEEKLAAAVSRSVPMRKLRIHCCTGLDSCTRTDLEVRFQLSPGLTTA